MSFASRKDEEDERRGREYGIENACAMMHVSATNGVGCESLMAVSFCPEILIWIRK